MGNSQSISLLLSYGIDDTVMSSDLNAICLIIWTISLMLMIMYCICKVMNYYILLLALLIVVIKMFCVLRSIGDAYLYRLLLFFRYN